MGRLAEELIKAVKQDTPNRSRAYSARVSRVDEEGAIWVYLAGSDKETPTASSSTEVKKDDIVNVEWRNNKLYIVGNSSNPAAGVQRVVGVENAVKVANEAASNAVRDAGIARASAEAAQESATSAKADAQSAKTSSQNASEYAARALGNLSTVQSVTETLTWITQHGTMTLTTDTALDPTHVYFVQDANGDYVVGGTHYSVVTEPVLADISTYYELTIDESLNNYVGTHLALTDEGLWLIPEALSGNRILIATGSGTAYPDAGTYIIDENGDTVARFGETTAIGKSGESHLEMDYHSMKLVDVNGNAYFYVSDMRDRNGKAQIADTFIGDGSTDTFWLTFTPTSTDYTVTVSDGSGGTIRKDNERFMFANPPMPDATITATYETESDEVKAYTIGLRGTGDIGASSAVVGTRCVASGKYSYAEGQGTTTSGWSGHAEGYETTVSGTAGHAEGDGTNASGDCSHAEGIHTTASGLWSSHAEGYYTTASGFRGSHAEGSSTTASGECSHAEGDDTVASGRYSHAQNNGTATAYDSQTAIGKYNDNQQDNAFEIGNGTSDYTRSNALTVGWDGNVELALDTSDAGTTDGDLYRAITALSWQNEVIG